MAAVSNAQLIAGFYAAIFNRAPDSSGLVYWEDQFNASASIYTLAAGFTAHPVFTTTYGSMANLQFVQSIYQSVLGAAGDDEGIAYWTAKLDGGAGRSTMLADFVHDALTVDVSQFTNLTTTERDIAQARQDTLTNKVNVGLNFAATFGDAANLNPSTDTTTQTDLESDTAYLASQVAIANVTADPASVTTANSAIAAAALTADPAQTLLHPGPAFAVTLNSSLISFANGTGDIVMHMTDGTTTFSRGTETSTTSIDNISSHVMTVAADQTLDIKATDVHLLGNGVTGAGTVSVIGPVSILDVAPLALSSTVGTVNYTLLNGELDLSTVSAYPTNSVAWLKHVIQTIFDQAANHADLTLDVTYNVGPPTTDLTAYNEAIAAIDGDLHGTVVYPADTTEISLSITDYSNNTGYVTALQAATHAITVDVVDSYTASSAVVNVGNATFNLVDGAIGVDLSATTGTHGFTIDAHADTVATTIVGSAQDDVITGGTGNDTLTGGGGNDTFNVHAAPPTDFQILTVLPRVDTITDLTAGDTLNVAAGATAVATGVRDFTGITVNNQGTVNIDGTGTNDTIVGTTGHDVITSNGGIDTLTGNGGGDEFYVNSGTSTLTDLHANDMLIVDNGATANTTLLDLSAVYAYNSGTVVITGTAGNDTIVGTSGNDVINGGAGIDTLTGNGGLNTFSFVNGDANTFAFSDLDENNFITTGDTFTFAGGTDVITDFTYGSDSLSIAGVNVANATYVNTATSSLAAPGVGQVSLILGNYSNGVFSATTVGTDTLAIYNNGDVGSTHVEGIVLTGVSDMPVTA